VLPLDPTNFPKKFDQNFSLPHGSVKKTAGCRPAVILFICN
jgi:hypothetical protein